MTHPKNADYQAELRRKRKEAGIVPVQVYVHETRRDDIRKAAATMQEPKDNDMTLDDIIDMPAYKLETPEQKAERKAKHSRRLVEEAEARTEHNRIMDSINDADDVLALPPYKGGQKTGE